MTCWGFILIISVAMVASTVFLLEGNSVAKHWQTSVRVAGLVTLIAMFTTTTESCMDPNW